MITNIMRITLTVSDQNIARDFWVNKLGFQVMTDIAMNDSHWLEVAPPNSSTHFVLYEKKNIKQAKASHPSVILSCLHLGDTRKTLVQRGVKMDEIITMPYGQMCVFYDPDHHAYMLREDQND